MEFQKIKSDIELSMLLLIVLVVTLIFLYWLSCSPFKWRGKGIDWMVPWPLFGNTAGSLTSSYFDYWYNFSKRAKGNKVIGFHFFTQPALFINDPILTKQILITESDSFQQRIFYIRDEDLFKNNLFSTHGEESQGYRTKISPFFSPSRIKAMTPILQSLIAMCLERFKQQAQLGPVEVDKITTLLTTDTIMTCIFGLEPECFKNPKSFYIELQEQLSGFLFGLRFLISILSPKLYDYLGLTVLTKNSTREISSLVTKIVELRRQGIGVREDFMQGMIELYNAEMESNNNFAEFNSDGTRVARFNIEGLISQGMIMLLAGTDTTGHAISFLLYELAKNQQVQDTLRNEVMKNIYEDGTVSYEKLQDMVYLDMNFKEILRLYPVAPFVPRRCTKSITLDGFHFEKGDIAFISINSIQRNSKFFANPHKFDPENFKPGSTIEVGSYFPFGSGPRSCIGLRLAEVLMKLTVCSILSKFKVLSCKETPDTVKFSYGPLVGPLGGIKLQFQEI